MSEVPLGFGPSVVRRVSAQNLSGLKVGKPAARVRNLSVLNASFFISLTIARACVPRVGAAW